MKNILLLGSGLMSVSIIDYLSQRSDVINKFDLIEFYCCCWNFTIRGLRCNKK